MIKKFNELWFENKKYLQEYYEKETKNGKFYRIGYKDILKNLLDIVINSEEVELVNSEEITSIDNGDYQGTLIFMFHNGNYQPYLSDYYITSISYGSCSCCDTLQGVLEDDDKVEGLMTLSLHLLQGCKSFYEMMEEK